MRSPERRRDDRPWTDARPSVLGRAGMTSLLTAITVALLGGMVFVARVETRTSDGDRREMRVIDVWREVLQAIPAEAPAVFTETLMAVLLITALIGIAYIIVAIMRLPQ